MKVEIKKDTSGGHKMVARFKEDAKVVRTVRFGAVGMSDFTKNKDEERKKRYLDRHRKNENWNDKFSAGALSRWILWNKTSLSASIADYKKRFGLN